jgi:putative endonuclease
MRMPYRAAVSDAWVYMLRCADGSLYTGWSTDVARRLQRHNAGTASRYTASRLPVELVYEVAMEDRSAARREEARIKALDRRQKLALIADRTGRRSVRRARRRS